MSFSIATNRVKYYAVADGSEIVDYGTIQPGDLTATRNVWIMVAEESENAYLGALANKGGDAIPELPAQGEPVEGGQVYRYGAGYVLARQSHTRTEHAPKDVLALFVVYRLDADETLAWIAGETVTAGTYRTHNSKLWKALQGHTTQVDWEPQLVPALWAEVVAEPEPEEWPAWVQPQGAHDSFALGAKVTHKGKRWISLYPANVWEPSIFGWEDQGPA